MSTLSDFQEIRTLCATKYRLHASVASASPKALCDKDIEEPRGSSAAAEDATINLREKLPPMPGTKATNFTIEKADDFADTDPIDNSVTKHQGIRIDYTSGARTEGATLRVYLESYETDPANMTWTCSRLWLRCSRRQMPWRRSRHGRGGKGRPW